MAGTRHRRGSSDFQQLEANPAKQTRRDQPKLQNSKARGSMVHEGKGGKKRGNSKTKGGHEMFTERSKDKRTRPNCPASPRPRGSKRDEQWKGTHEG